MKEMKEAMMPVKRTHEYRGSTIMPTSSAAVRALGFRWYVVKRHEGTGIPFAEEASRKFRTLKAARELIDEDARLE